MLPDDHIVYDELRRRRQRPDSWQPEALRLPLHAPRYEEDAAEQSPDDSSDRGVLIIDMNDGYAIVE